ncbi:copper radical oxidase [Apiospora phragmitis]|uniref:Copper radical oxidase n=1 Tax=Apiospora phragmitis TaxID=2905665 RepID=A0ABR1W1B0_9PEZI
MFKFQAIFALAVLGSAALAQAEKPVGCFPCVKGFVDLGPATFQSVGLCHSQCEAAGFPVFGLTNGTECLCGQMADIPAAETKVEDALCDKPCPGFAPQKCGGNGVVSVYTK